MLRKPQGARRYNDTVTLTISRNIKDAYGHISVGEPEDVLEMPAAVSQMSAATALMTFQLADVVGLKIEMREPGVAFNGLSWHGHSVTFPAPENVDNRGRILRITGYYQIDSL